MARNLTHIDWRDGRDDLDDCWRTARRTARANRAAARGADLPNLETAYFRACGIGR